MLTFSTSACLRFVLSVALATTMAAQTVALADVNADRCYADWSDAAPVVRREALLPTEMLLQQARLRKLGDLVRITLCEQQGRYVYRLVVASAPGRLRNMTVDARQPF
jgi:uncharacterized membrane protein YkoI